jgi:hypothetical protein
MKKPLQTDSTDKFRSALKVGKRAAEESVSHAPVDADLEPPDEFRTIEMNSIAERGTEGRLPG